MPATLSAFSGQQTWDRAVPVAAMLLRAMLARSGAGGGQKQCCQADVAPNTKDCILTLAASGCFSANLGRTFARSPAWHERDSLSLHCAGKGWDFCNIIVPFENHRHESSASTDLKSGFDLLDTQVLAEHKLLCCGNRSGMVKNNRVPMEWAVRKMWVGSSWCGWEEETVYWWMKSISVLLPHQFLHQILLPVTKRRMPFVGIVILYYVNQSCDPLYITMLLY